MPKIAIVEDNHTFRTALVELVNSIPGCHCVADFDTGEEALKLIPRLKPDLVMMDIHLPNLSGIECTLQLKDSLPDLSVLILTVYEDEEKIFQALQAGASGYILKRSHPDEIVRALHEMLAGGAPMTPTIARKVVDSLSRTTRSRRSPEESLSRREIEVLESLTRGSSNKEIAEELSITVDTIRWHLKQIYHKFHVHGRTEAAVKYLKLQQQQQRQQTKKKKK
jgi:DNA-binding NarL/FixJ family response regulator